MTGDLPFESGLGLGMIGDDHAPATFLTCVPSHTSTIVAATKRVEAAAIRGDRLNSISSSILRVTVLCSTPEMKNDTTGSSNEARKANTGGEVLDGAIKGSVIPWKHLSRVAPRLRPAISSEGDTRCKAAETTRTT